MVCVAVATSSHASFQLKIREGLSEAFPPTNSGLLLGQIYLVMTLSRFIVRQDAHYRIITPNHYREIKLFLSKNLQLWIVF